MKKSYWKAVWLLAFGGACADSGQPAGPSTSSFDPNGSSADAGADVLGDDAVSGLPCEVATLLSTYCVSCHGMTKVAGVPMSLLSRAELAAASESEPTKSYAALSIERMRATNRPMPPAGKQVLESEIQAFEAWLEAGMPEGNCGGVRDPFDTPLTCTTDTYWTGGNDESPRMRPGYACIDCHTRGVADEDGELKRGPGFGFAGTVYASGHEPDDCNGVDGERADPVTIEVTDANGRVVRASVNRAGNFYYEDRLSYPITARVLYQGRARAMATPQDSGDCNACHTEAGDEGAPGRIMLP